MVLNIFRKLSQGFRWLETSLLLCSLFAMISLTVLQIILRNGFSYSLGWVEPLNQHLVLVVAFLGAMVAGRQGEHISFDLVSHYVPAAVQRYLTLAGGILSGGICLYLTYLTAELTYLDFLDPLPAFGSVPQWIFEVFIPLGFFVIGGRLFIVSLTRYLNPEDGLEPRQ